MDKMDFQTSSIQATKHSKRRAFTLTEVMVAGSISSFILAGVISTFLMMGRTSANVVNYSEMEAKARKSLEYFSREVRLAYAVPSFSGTSVTLSIPDTVSDNPKGTGTGSYSVTYAFDSTNSLLTRTGPPIDQPTGTSSTTTLISGVQLVPGTTAIFNYFRYVKPTSYPVGQGYVDGFGTANTASLALEIKQIEVSFLLQRKNVTVATATNKILSARFTLRNK
jgi:Tfp pilus assembly protein PilW